jgi:hypothetical protein
MITLRTTEEEYHTIIAALAYVNHPSFTATRRHLVAQFDDQLSGACE